MVSVPSAGDRVSRWTPAIFACALINFALTQLLIVAGTSWPAAPEMDGVTLAAVHLLTIGWMTLLMFGALFQFIPVLTGGALGDQRLSLATLLLVQFGLAGMVAGFVLLGTPSAVLLPSGGGLVILGLLTGSLNIAVPFARAGRRPLSAWFIVAGIALLVLTITLGLTFALALTVPALAWALSPIVATGLVYHVLAGIGGWFTLTAIGVSYELLPMFMLAPHDRGVWGKSVFWAACTGLFVALAAGIAAPLLPGTASPVAEQVGRAVIALAITLYLVDVARMYRDRRRRLIELHNRAAIGAFVSLGVALAMVVVSAILGELSRAAAGLVFLLIFGWLSGLGLSQLYKIIPFLTWLLQFGRRLGTGPIPRVQDLVNERRAAPMFIAYYIGVAVGTTAALFSVSLLTRAATVLMLAATVFLGREYWRAWRGYYPQRRMADVVRPAAPGRPVVDPGDDRAHASQA